MAHQQVLLAQEALYLPCKKGAAKRGLLDKLSQYQVARHDLVYRGDVRQLQVQRREVSLLQLQKTSQLLWGSWRHEAEQAFSADSETALEQAVDTRLIL